MGYLYKVKWIQRLEAGQTSESDRNTETTRQRRGHFAKLIESSICVTREKKLASLNRVSYDQFAIALIRPNIF